MHNDTCMCYKNSTNYIYEMSDFNSKTHRVVRKVNAYSAHATFQ